MTDWVTSHCSKEDLPQVAQFFKKQYQGTGNYGELGLFQWKIIDNVKLPGTIFLVKDTDVIAATTSITPKSLLLNNEEILSAEIGDTYTDSNYQRQGIFSLLINEGRRNANNHGIKFVYGTPNDQSLPGYEKKANFKVIPKLKVSSLVFPINVKKVLQSKTNLLFSLLVSPLLELLSFLHFKLRCLLISNASKYQIKELKTVPVEWDQFWNEAKLDYDFIFNRDKKAITWRFFNNPNKYKMLGLYDNQKIVGYLVYRIQFDESGNRLVLADYLFLKGHQSAFGVAVREVLNRGFSNNVTTVSGWSVTNSEYASALKKYGFLTRGEVPVISHVDDFWEKLNCISKTHFTVSDSDNI
jgi:hypothetical protein